MDIEDTVRIRQPSEANSLLLPVMIGCSHNECTFCVTYKGQKFHIRPFADIKKDIDQIARHYGRSVRKIFLENGDALVLSQFSLVRVLEYINKSFPNREWIGTYANAISVLRKSVDDLKQLRELGLSLIYLGIESGDDEVLKRICKGSTHAEMVEAGRRIKAAGITLSLTVLLGIGGEDLSERHAVATGKIISEIDPDFAGALTVIVCEGTPLYDEMQAGKFKLITPMQSLQELRTILANTNCTSCFFTSNHASNYLPLKLKLPEEKEEGLRILDEVLAGSDRYHLRPEGLRAL